MEKLFCPHCNVLQVANLETVTYCKSCTKPYVCVSAYCASIGRASCRCYQYALIHPFTIGTEKSVNTDSIYPCQFIAEKPQLCIECGYSWGLGNFVLKNIGEETPRPFDGFFIVPLESCLELVVFHGTHPSNVHSIKQNGLRPPRNSLEKRHGFPTEGKLRYVGRDIEPAKNHADDACVLEMSYSGLIAITNLTCVGEELNLILKKLPASVEGVQFNEHGRSIAFRPEAEIAYIDNKNNAKWIVKDNVFIRIKKTISEKLYLLGSIRKF